VIGLEIAALLVAPLLAAPAPRSAGEGASLVQTVCAQCHQIDPNQPPTAEPRDRAPSFRQIADDPRLTRPVLRRFLRNTHASLLRPMAMPNPGLTDDEIAQVIAYIDAVRRR
jgi:mono/diheme cytochrome c family protein